jgi:sulfur carrier protein ThiS
LVITVHLHTILQRPSPDGLISRLEIAVPTGATLTDLLTQLDIPLSSDALLLVVNGRMAEQDQILKEGDEVNLMAAMSGG